jgi:hypothetical protein
MVVMLYELVILVCLSVNPTNCTSHALQAQQLSANPSAAYREAMAIVAEWMESHPGLVLKGFDLKPGRGA